MTYPGRQKARRPYRLMFMGFVLLALALGYHFWPRSTEVLIPVMNGSGKYGYINDRGQLVQAFQWEYAQRFGRCGLAGVSREAAEGRRWGAIDRTGRVVIPFVWLKGGGFVESGLCATLKEKKWGLINERGEVVVPHVWDFFEPLRTRTGIEYMDAAGWIKVSRNVGEGERHEDQRYGWVDRQGKVVIPVEYNTAEDFDEHGWARVRRGKECGWINRQGQWVMPPEWEGCSGFDEGGWAVVYRNGKSGYADRQGNIKLPLQWDACWEFHSTGYAQVMKDNKRGLIDRTGKVVIPIVWLFCSMEDDGLVKVFQDVHKEGCIDLQGKVRIPLQYCSLIKLSHCEYWQAQQSIMGHYGLVDGAGRVFIELRWDDINDMRIGESTFYVCKGEAQFPFPEWVQDGLVKLYGFFGKAWMPGKLCHVYDGQGRLLWSSGNWWNHVESYLWVTGSCLLLMGMWRFWRYRSRLSQAERAAP